MHCSRDIKNRYLKYNLYISYKVSILRYNIVIFNCAYTTFNCSTKVWRNANISIFLNNYSQKFNIYNFINNN